MRFIIRTSLFAASTFLLLFTVVAHAQENPNAPQKCPMHDQHSAASHEEMVQKNGDQVMGFPHDKTTHHFRIAADGGAIEVTANEPADAANIEAIRGHLSHIAIMFRGGDFTMPTVVHEGVPPGTTTMKLLKDKIHFDYEEVAGGGRVRIVSKDEVDLAAIHDFLRFQITEHHTGDSLATPEHP